MKTFCTILLTILGFTLFAQPIVTWNGGTPGRETVWNEARNWSNYKVPDLFSNVLIPDVSTTTRSYPRIEDGIVELNSISIESGAYLHIGETAQLIIHEYAVGLENSNFVPRNVALALPEDSIKIRKGPNEEID